MRCCTDGDAVPGPGAGGGRPSSAGDFELKAGQALYLHRVAGVKAARVAVAACGEASAAAWRKALAAGLALLKAGGPAGGGGRRRPAAHGDAHAEALARWPRGDLRLPPHQAQRAAAVEARSVSLVAKDLAAALDAGLRAARPSPPA
jgi:leucyl aminopeptidase